MTNVSMTVMLSMQETIPVKREEMREKSMGVSMEENQEELNIFQMYLEELKEIKDCDKTENEQLVKQVLAGDAGAKSRLIEGNLKAALGMIQSFLNRGVQAADLVQEANMALVMTVEELGTEEPGADENAAFERRLEKRVQAALKAIVDEQDTEKKIEEKMLSRVNVLKDISKEMADELGREATVEELAERMKTTVDDIKDIMKLTLDAMSVNGEYDMAGILDGESGGNDKGERL